MQALWHSPRREPTRRTDRIGSPYPGDIRDAKVTDKIYLERLAAELPDETIKPSKQNNYKTSEFNIEDWMAEHGISYKELTIQRRNKVHPG